MGLSTYLATTTYPELHLFELFLIICALAIHPRFGIIIGASISIFMIALYGVNLAKLSILHQPVNLEDIRLLLIYPDTMSSALGFTYSSMLGIVIIAMLLLIYICVKVTQPIVRFYTYTYNFYGNYKILVTVVQFVLALTIGWFGIVSCGNKSVDLAERLQVSQKDSTRLSYAMVSLAMQNKLGPIGYLVYDFYKSKTKTSTQNETTASTTDPIFSTVNTFQTFTKLFKTSKAIDRFPLPDIYIILAESHMDIAHTFSLTNPYQSSFELLEKDFSKYSSIHFPIIVPTVGTGTTTAEFELFTGLSAEVFAPESFDQPNYLLSKRIKTSFIHFATSMGYHAKAIIYENKQFSSAEYGLQNYGFDTILDGIQLGVNSDWQEASDTIYLETIANTLNSIITLDSPPHLIFISTIENHGPHPCKHFGANSKLLVETSVSMPVELLCQLNEFVLRDHNLHQGLLTLIHSIEQKARPFIVLIFGDHLPFSFSSNAYTPYRTHISDYQTHAMILSSTMTSFTPPYHAIPLFTLPTILSHWIASDPQTMFMAHNLNVIDHCKNSIITQCALFNTLTITSKMNIKSKKRTPLHSK